MKKDRWCAWNNSRPEGSKRWNEENANLIQEWRNRWWRCWRQIIRRRGGGGGGGREEWKERRRSKWRQILIYQDQPSRHRRQPFFFSNNRKRLFSCDSSSLSRFDSYYGFSTFCLRRNRCHLASGGGQKLSAKWIHSKKVSWPLGDKEWHQFKFISDSKYIGKVFATSWSCFRSDQYNWLGFIPKSFQAIQLLVVDLRFYIWSRVGLWKIWTKQNETNGVPFGWQAI